MAEQRLIDANALNKEAEESLCENPHTGIMAKAMHTHEHKHFLCMIAHQPTIDPETSPIVRELREKLEQTEQELRNVKYCYDIAKNGERQLRRQVNEVTAEWAECVKKLKRVTEERDAAMSFIPKTCATCKYGESPCDWCVNNPDGDLNWEWNGKSKE